MTILQQLAQILGEELKDLKEKVQNFSASGITRFLQLYDTPQNFDASKRNLKVDKFGTKIEFVSDNMMVDGEFRGMMNGLLHHRWSLLITAGEEFNITNIGRNVIVYRTTNNTIRYLRLADEYGQGGRDLYIRIDEGEPTCKYGGDYDKETNTCFPITDTVVPASSFVGVYDAEQSGLASGSYAYSARIRILKTGYYATGWIDVHGMHQNIDIAKEDIADAKIDITNLQSEVTNLQQAEGSVTAPVYTRENLPLSGKNSDLALVSDGTISGSPTMSYFYDGSWYRTLDNSLITDQTIDIYLLAGQSNAHGHAKIEYLTDEQKTQDGLFYSSWHTNTSNASSEQYYSQWATSLVAGNTRGDSGSTTLGGSNLFGPEMGFVARANEIDLTNGQPIGILKHAIGASSLEDDGSADGGLSDWDLTATGDRRGDALRAFKEAVNDGLEKLTTAGYTYRLAGLVWWQGESGASTEGLQALIAHMRDWLNTEYTLDMPKEKFPVVITTTTSYWGEHLVEVSDADAYVGVVDTMDWASPEGASRTLVHPGSDETYSATQAEVDAGIATNVGDQVGGQDYKGDGVNDMFTIGQAYAEQMQKAITGSTNSLWTPESMTTRLWIDTADASTLLYDANGNVSTINDKSGNQTNLDASSGSTITAVSSGLNGLNILSFDNNADATTYENLSLQANTRHKWFMVMKATGSDKHDGFLTYRSSNPTNELILFNFANAGEFKAEWYVNSGSQMKGNTTNLLGSWNILSVEFDIPNTQSSAWLNGTAYNTNVAQNGSNFPSIGAGQLSINRYGTIGGADWAELIFTENISQSDSDKIEGYLAHKWGLQGNLPTGHTYKDSAP